MYVVSLFGQEMSNYWLLSQVLKKIVQLGTKDPTPMIQATNVSYYNKKHFCMDLH